MSHFDKIIDRSKLNSHKWAPLVKKLGDVPEGVVPFTVADNDFQTLDVIREALHKAVDEIPFGYTYPSDSYKASVREMLVRRHGFETVDHNLVDSPGVLKSLAECLNVFSQEHDEILIFNPVYNPFRRVIEQVNRQCVPFDLTYEDAAYHIDFDRLDNFLHKHDIKIMVWCSPHNPIGRVWTEEELLKIGNLAIKHDLLILSDDIHMELIMKGHKHTLLASLNSDIAKRTITFFAPTKTFNLAGLLVSQIHAPNGLIEQIHQYRQKHGSQSINVLAYVACEAAYRHGDQFIEAFNEYIYTNHLMMKEFIQEKIPQIKVMDLQGTYLQWLDFSAFDMDQKALCESLEEAHLFLASGHVYEPTEGNFMRMNIAYPREIVQKALERLDKWALFHMKQL